MMICDRCGGRGTAGVVPCFAEIRLTLAGAMNPTNLSLPVGVRKDLCLPCRQEFGLQMQLAWGKFLADPCVVEAAT